MGNNQIFEVSELNRRIKYLLDEDPQLSRILVRGEISNYKVYPSGHHYFTLKDGEGALRCVMFKREAMSLRFRPENGMSVLAMGRVTVFPRDRTYQLYCAELSPEGVGELYTAFEQLKEKLQKEGLFHPVHKKNIPQFPMRVAVITSPAGAAVRDIIRVLGHRFPAAKVILLPVRVQGVEAPAEICAALRYANAQQLADVIILGRGGGSIEDLWAFNDENVAREIYASEIPVVSGVGHEPDVTIADFVADLRAATPSNAAELAVPDVTKLRESLEAARSRLIGAEQGRIGRLQERMRGLSKRRVLQDPKNYLEDKRVLLDYAQGKIAAAARQALGRRKEQYVRLTAALDAMSPLKVISRGYLIAQQADGHVIKSIEDVAEGERISLRLQDGSLRCTVEERTKCNG